MLALRSILGSIQRKHELSLAFSAAIWHDPGDSYCFKNISRDIIKMTEHNLTSTSNRLNTDHVCMTMYASVS